MRGWPSSPSLSRRLPCTKYGSEGCPEVNGKVERSHKTDSQEFYQGRHFKHKGDLARKLKKWETEYNEDRPHLALKGTTPAERVRELVQSNILVTSDQTKANKFIRKLLYRNGQSRFLVVLELEEHLEKKSKEPTSGKSALF